MSFTLDVAKLAEKKKAEIGEIKQAVVFSIFRDVIKKSPVDTGRFKGNWFITENTPSTEMDETQDKSSKGVVGARSTRELSLIKDNFTIDILTNNLPYGRLLEFGGYNHATDRTTAAGFSSQAPAGMVRVTLREFEAIAKKEGWK